MIYPYNSGVSSLLFSFIPFYYKIPRIVQDRMNVLAYCSSLYHMYEDYNYTLIYRLFNNGEKDKQLILYKNNFKTKLIEWMDGVSIIICCGGSWMKYSFIQDLIKMYSCMKLVSNVEIVKSVVYTSTMIKATNKFPILLLPWSMGCIGFFHMKWVGYWNIYNRTIWHFGNSIIIGYYYKNYYKYH